MPAPIPVAWYDAKTGEKIAQFISVEHAVRKTGYSANQIRMATVSKKELDGHIWKIERPK